MINLVKMELLRTSDFIFLIIDRFENIEFNEEQRLQLSLPSELTDVLLCSNWWEQKYRIINFRGTSNKEAIEKILVFYRHKTFRRLIGDHIFFEGFRKDSDSNLDVIELGS